MAWKWSPPRSHGRAARSARWLPAPRVQRGAADLGQPVARPGLKPAVHDGLVRSATRSSSRPRSRSTRPVIHRVGAVGVTRRTLVSSKPKAATPSRRPASSTSGLLWSPPPAPRSPANAEVTSDRGHRVGVLADPPTGLSAGSLGQHRPGTDRAARRPRCLPRRLAHDSTRSACARQHHPGQPPLGRSRTRTMRRPWSSARAPRPLKSTAVAVVWTASRHSPPATPAARTSSRPRRAAWRPMHSYVDPPGASCLADVRHPQARRSPRYCSGGSSIVASSTPPHAS